MFSSTPPLPELPVDGTCFIDATQPQFHKQIPSTLRAPLLGNTTWRVSSDLSEKMMERRGWVQTLCTTLTTPENTNQIPRGCDRIYIPGEFCRQADVLSAAAESQKIILLERGAFLAPNDMRRALEKLGDAKQRVILVEAGSAFGYSDRVLDPRVLEVMCGLDCPVALNLQALINASGEHYTHRPQWLDDSSFDVAFVRMALTFSLRYLILPSNREMSTLASELWISSKKDLS